MRILIIWAESVDRYAGGSSHFWGLMHGIQSIGWQIRAIVPRYRRAKTSWKKPGNKHPAKTPELSPVEDISVVPLPSRSFISFLLLQVVTVLWLPYWLVKHRPGAVYVRTCFLAFLMHAICRLAGVPLILEVDAIVDKEVEMRGQRQVLAHIVSDNRRIGPGPSTYHFFPNTRCHTQDAEQILCVQWTKRTPGDN